MMIILRLPARANAWQLLKLPASVLNQKFVVFKQECHGPRMRATQLTQAAAMQGSTWVRRIRGG